MDSEEYVEAVLSVVEQVPSGRVTTYGAIAEAIGSRGPRSVGRVMSTYGGSVPWWRVVRADGSLPPSHDGEARSHYLEEGTPFRRSGRVDLASAAWWPPPGPGDRLDHPSHRPGPGRPDGGPGAGRVLSLFTNVVLVHTVPGLSLVPRVLLSAVVMTPVMTYVVLPQLSKRLEWWLQGRSAPWRR